MRIPRRSPAPVAVRRLDTTDAPAVPQIAINIPRGAVVESPTDQDLVVDILRATPRLRRGMRRDGYLHVSDLIGKGKCVRKMALSDKLGVPLRPKRLNTFDRVVFAIGDAIHDTIKMIATEGAPHRVWGKWKCSCGHLFHDEPCLQSEIDPEDVCELCHTGCVHYQEVSIFNEQYKIVGNPDLLLFIEELAAFHVVELKSMAHDAWEKLARPLPEHVLQVVFYWFLLIMSGRKVTDRLSLVYITKGYQFRGEAHKEFMIDPRREVQRLLPFLDDALRYKMSADHNVFPIRKQCSGEYTTDAKKCEVCTPCFNIAEAA